MKRLLKIPTAIMACAILALPAVVPSGRALAMPVFDATNYTQNLLQAARSLEQINKQIQSLQNETAMLQNMAKNLERIDFPQLGQITSKLGEIDRLMGQAQGIDFRVDQLDARFRVLFPGAGATSGGDAAAAARARLDQAMAGFRHNMEVQSKVVENVRADGALLSELAAASQGAQGSLQAQQAANQLLALVAKQQLQLQNLMAAEYRGQTMERARRAQAESDARAASRRFLGSGQAYTPR